jgi:UDP-N-acetylglucosamine diphosphorylase / glucose-1-phosphate thymidylyltransferase / UDP-N-acetylgalactosamine diphosphorylase / glucosamine-1-phosphate N-acetyltransferase / galactosamine-1-phosphate N-acetyltransferase
MWWKELEVQAASFADLQPCVDPRAIIATTAILRGAVRVGPGARICHGAYIEGPVVIGADTLVGNNALIRGATHIGEDCRIGFACEVKNSIIEHGVALGPQCFVADTKVEAHAYLGAQVRTSNHRLDGANVHVLVDGDLVDTGCGKLGALIGARARLGVNVVILPGRIVAPDTLLGPRITVARNLSPGRYRLVQQLESF